MKTIASTFILLIGSLYLVYGQGEPFNLDQYKKFLDENKNMDAVDLVTMYPSGFFQDSVPAFRLEDVFYFDSLDLYFDFTGEEKQLLMKNGFVVTERTDYHRNMFNHFVQLYNEDLPVIITTDAILHAFHESYDDILQEVEEVYIIDHLVKLLEKLHAGIGDLDLRYGEDQTIIKSLQDVDLYLSVPLNLLGDEYTPYYDINSLRVNEMIESIHAEEYARIMLFSDDCKRDVDFSQFTPRGHYTESDELERYFRAMIWLGRTEIYLIEPSASLCQTEEQSLRMIQRQVIMAYLIHELFEDEANLELYSGIENIISTFVGDQDNVKLPELGELFQEAGINSAFDLVDQGAVSLLQEVLIEKPYAAQQILSQILWAGDPGAVEPASAFLLFGQRFVIDSYVTGQVVFDRIQYRNSEPCRLYPKTLDILFALGNNASSHLLIDELESYHYATNLAGLRYLISQYTEEFWNSSLYNCWLNGIKTLNPDPEVAGQPEFMRTGAWGLEKMNTQLASWAELRHDNLLYAKQSYTGGPACRYPHAFVEPVPGFYESMIRLSEFALERLGSMSGTFEDAEKVSRYFENFGAICDTLGAMVEKELQNQELDAEDIDFINRLCSSRKRCGSGSYSAGWYTDLYYKWFDTYAYEGEPTDNDLLVVDYHTTPADCGGNIIGAVSHAGTGFTDLLVSVVGMPDGHLQAFAGPVMSYHEYVTGNFKRLTDQEWEDQYMFESFRPEWVRGYLADDEGKTNETDLKLFSSWEELSEQIGTVDNPFHEITDQASTMSIYPNPASESLIISLRVRHSHGEVPVRLELFDVKGALIEVVAEEVLPGGNYLFRWERTSQQPGFYLLRCTTGNKSQSVKFILSE